MSPATQQTENKPSPPATEPQAAKATPAAPPRRQESWRETIESVVIAFILAFLFRTFEAEAFVIPTGSMAPTLYGQHRDVVCDQCGTRFAVGATTGNHPETEIDGGRIHPSNRLTHAVCPNAACQYVNPVVDLEIFSGDRILVNKFPYEFKEPERWDVVVFKFPEEAKTNYIKRLVGLPGEEIEVRRGDIWYRKKDSQDPWMIARKSPEKQDALKLLVHDNDHPSPALLGAGWPESWEGEENSGWQSDTQARTYRIDPKTGDAEKLNWLRYTHYVVTSDDWNSIKSQGQTAKPSPQLIKDGYGYNTRIQADQARSAIAKGNIPSIAYREIPQNWVSDLTLSATVTVEKAQGELVFEMVEGTRKYRCRIDLKSGSAQLFHPAEVRLEDENDEVLLGTEFATGIRTGTAFEFRFANVDDRLVVWIDGEVKQSVDMDLHEDARYVSVAPSDIDETLADRRPIGIAARGTSITVGHLAIFRDIYYTEERNRFGRDPIMRLVDSTDDSQDEFLMMGDNSPRSNDSRLWQDHHAVPRRLLVGKAFCIYWPHAIPFMNGGKGYPISSYEERGDAEAPRIPSFSFPFYPQIGRMKRIW